MEYPEDAKDMWESVAKADDAAFRVAIRKRLAMKKGFKSGGKKGKGKAKTASWAKSSWKTKPSKWKNDGKEEWVEGDSQEVW